MPPYSKQQQIGKRKVNKKCNWKGCKQNRKYGSNFCNPHDKILSKNESRSKYRAVRQTYNGYNYDSKREAQEAYILDLCINEGTVKRWERQHKIPLVVKGVGVGNYYIDFKVYHSDGSIEYREVKGAETDLWRLKFKIAKAINPDWNFTVVR